MCFDLLSPPSVRSSAEPSLAGFFSPFGVPFLEVYASDSPRHD